MRYRRNTVVEATQKSRQRGYKIKMDKLVMLLELEEKSKHMVEVEKCKTQ
jgi:hypothetical protein